MYIMSRHQCSIEESTKNNLYIKQIPENNNIVLVVYSDMKKSPNLSLATQIISRKPLELLREKKKVYIDQFAI